MKRIIIMNTIIKIIFPVMILAVIVIISSNSKASISSGKNTMDLNGVSDYYSEPFSEKLMSGKAITLESWFKTGDDSMDKDQIDKEQTIIERSSAGSYTYRLFIKDNAVTFLVNTGKDYKITAPVKNPASWNHVAASYNSATGEMKIYLHGRLIASETKKPAGILDFGSDSLSIGRSGSFFEGNTFFKGMISDSRIWTKSERTQDQVNELMPRGTVLNMNDVVTFDFSKSVSADQTKTRTNDAVELMKTDEHLSQYFTAEEPWHSLINKNSETTITENK